MPKTKAHRGHQGMHLKSSQASNHAGKSFPIQVLLTRAVIYVFVLLLACPLLLHVHDDALRSALSYGLIVKRRKFGYMSEGKPFHSQSVALARIPETCPRLAKATSMYATVKRGLVVLNFPVYQNYSLTLSKTFHTEGQTHKHFFCVHNNAMPDNSHGPNLPTCSTETWPQVRCTHR